MLESNYLSHQMTWIIPLLPEKLPGKVVKLWGKGHYRIKCLINGLPLSDGSQVTSFIAFGHDVKPINHNTSSLELENYVLFMWDVPGERSKDQNGKEGDPKAIEVELIGEDDAEKIAFNIRETIGDNLKKQIIEKTEVSQQRIRENWKELNRAFESLDSDISSYSSDEIQNKLQGIQEQYEKIKNVEAELDNSKQLLEKKLQGLEPYGILLETSEENQQNDNREKIDLSKDFGKDWTEKLRRNGLYATKEIANSYLISIFTALYLGRLVLLNGALLNQGMNQAGIGTSQNLR